MLLFYFSCLLQFSQCVQPYFPSQVTFSIDNDQQTTMAIDVANQEAYQTSQIQGLLGEYAFVMKHFPYTFPDSPESKHYVELSVRNISDSCYYRKFWKYGTGSFNSFPDHWYYNITTFIIGNYIKFNYNMIHSSNPTNEAEDFWYADKQYSLESGQQFPCEEIYFIKNTEIRLRTARVVRQVWAILQAVTNSPHRLHGNDTAILEWQPSKYSQCIDCVSWKPERLYFNSVNFEKRPELVVTRIKNGA
ncbi:unnamed protein product [Rotaria magnacalcarata]|nr:unnamed protein product [Rotaria magnacalcarata]